MNNLVIAYLTHRILCTPLESITHYELSAKIAMGELGEVYRAHDKRTGREFVIRLFPLGEVPYELLRPAIERATSFNHPQFPTIFDYGEVEGNCYVVMQHFEGLTLDKLISGRQSRSLPLVEFASELAQGLAALHAHGILHRDLKPSNVLIDPKDFGYGSVE